MPVSAVRTAELCWGQRYHWLRYQQVPPGARHDAHIVLSAPLPDGLTLAELRAGLNHLVRRHEALRTVYDARARPWPQQQVQPPAPLPVVVVTTERDGTPLAGEAVAALSSAEFDLERDWPIRACVVTTGGRPTRLAVVLNHVAFDDWSLSVFRDELEALTGAAIQRRRAVLSPVVDQPSDLARREAGHGPEVADGRLHFWREHLRHVPADVFSRRRTSEPDVPSAHGASLTSPSVLVAAREIAARYQVWPSAVHLAAYAMTLSAYTGEGHVLFRWLTSHREASGHPDVMTCMFSPTLVAVDLSDSPDFGEVVTRVARSVEIAQDNAYVPYDEMVETLALEAERRGRPMRTGSDVNFLSYAGRSCGARRERFTRQPPPAAWAQAGGDLYFRVHEWQDGVTAALIASESVLSAEAVEQFLRGYAAMLDAHRDPASEHRVLVAPASRALVQLDVDGIDLDALTTLVGTHPVVVDVRVQVEDARLTANVHTSGPLSPVELREHVLAGLDRFPGTGCPAWFRISAGSASTIEGDGRGGPTGPVTDAERALSDVVGSYNDLAGVDLSRSYVGAGGRVLRAPAVAGLLAAGGWCGATVEQLTGLLPLRVIAAKLQRC